MDALAGRLLALTLVVSVAALPVAGQHAAALQPGSDAEQPQAGDGIAVTSAPCVQPQGLPALEGTIWQPVTIDFSGPPSSENDALNPFLDYRLELLFTHAGSGRTQRVPGFYAADGDAAESGAVAGNVWRVHFVPDHSGSWLYTASFRMGIDIAVSSDSSAGVAVGFDGRSGCLSVVAAQPGASGPSSRGPLRYVGGHHLRFAATGEPFLKGGANSPENLLAFADFDATPPSHRYEPHLQDWSPGDPQWAGARGRGLIGALNYLAGQGMNAVYFLTYNVGGDGNDVWPFIAPGERLRYDCSKLDQWEIVFTHMDRLGLALHVVTQEQENDNGPFGLDGGALGIQRRLYYRELVARFGHHAALIWNLGEENSNTQGQLQQFQAYIRGLDAAEHPIVVHTFPGDQEHVYGPLLEAGVLEGASLQNLTSSGVHDSTLTWRLNSKLAGRPWVVASDEIGPGSTGVVPDAFDPTHDVIRKQVLWGNLMAGGAGCEWYFGSNFPNNDTNCEDWRSREAMWQLTDIALTFFGDHVPYPEMEPADELVDAPGAWCLAQEGQSYVVYLPDGGSTALDLGDSTVTHDVRWFDPRQGGALQLGSVAIVAGSGWRLLGSAPDSPGSDWAVLVSRANLAPMVLALDVTPDPFPGNVPLQATIRIDDPDGLDDVASVWLHFFTPEWVYLGAVAAIPSQPDFYRVSLPSLPPADPGLYPVVAQVLDMAGQSGLLFGSFSAP